MSSRVIALVSVLLLSAPAWAEDDVWKDCKSYNEAVSIPACTRIIEAGNVGQRVLAAAHNNRGIAHRRRNELYAALADYNQAVALDPGSFKARFNRAMALSTLQMTERALADLDEAIRLNPGHAKAYAMRGSELFASEPDAALKDFRQAFTLLPNLKLENNSHLAGELRDYAKTAISEDHLDNALDALDIAMRLDPADAGAAIMRGDLRQDQGKYDVAIADYDLAIQRDSSSARAHLQRCLARSQKGDLEGAAEDCDAGKKMAPQGDAYVLEVEGYLLLKKKQYTEAVDVLSQAIQGSPEAPATYVYRAQAFDKLGQRTKSVADYEKALTHEPRNARDRKALEEARASLAQRARPAPSPGTTSGTKQPQKSKKAAPKGLFD